MARISGARRGTHPDIATLRSGGSGSGARAAAPRTPSPAFGAVLRPRRPPDIVRGGWARVDCAPRRRRRTLVDSRCAAPRADDHAWSALPWRGSRGRATGRLPCRRLQLDRRARVRGDLPVGPPRTRWTDPSEELLKKRVEYASVNSGSVEPAGPRVAGGQGAYQEPPVRRTRQNAPSDCSVNATQPVPRGAVTTA